MEDIFKLEYVDKTFGWLNDNQGILSLALFLITAAYGWFSGIFSTLRRRPKLAVNLICGPTFSCTFVTGRTHDRFEAHTTCIALYLKVSNVGSAASSIDNISVGYHWHLRPISWAWIKYRIGWFWLEEQAISLSDFQVSIGDSVKVYPFLTQQNSISPVRVDTFLDVGRSVSGVVYFEQRESWGGCFPSPARGRVAIKIKIRDVFGRDHVSKHRISAVGLEEARKYNPTFGTTREELRKNERPTVSDPSDHNAG
ncbi:hypothetical protein [Rhizobium sp. S163]|uniref:hypothetical protein n=1 Tax=Rhizobium sp. S163 TaxID=3055039 RepID=UPI0025A9CF18|nr:hypothetical protein [Rhizobium sp. S163]MDM9647509.1 hypothetical protein [Rhizobium sp. S163]